MRHDVAEGLEPVNRRRAAGVLFAAGVIALLLTPFLGWYTISGQVGETKLSYTLFLLGVEVSNSSSTTHSTYAAVSLEGTGNLYYAVSLLVFLGISLGLVAGLLTFGPPGNRWRWLQLGVSLVAVSVSIAAPIALAVGQPAVLCSDTQHFSPPLAPGPPPPKCYWEFTSGGVWYAGGQSIGPGFIGQSASEGGSLTWGPSIGWYLSIAGAGLFATATALGRWRRY